MADNAVSYGFKWRRHLMGGSNNPPTPVREVFITAYAPAPSGTHVNINVGDPVKRVSDGSVALCAAGDATYGIVMGFGPSDFTGASVGSAWQKYYAYGSAGTIATEQEAVVYVIPVAGEVFECDVDDNTTYTTLANYRANVLGKNCDITINQDSASMQARPRIDISTHGTSSSLVWRVVDIAQEPNLDPSGLYYKLLVTCNVVQQAPFQATGV